MPGKFKVQVISDRMEQLEIFLGGRPTILMLCPCTNFPMQLKSVLDKGKEGYCHVAILRWTYLLKWI